MSLSLSITRRFKKLLQLTLSTDASESQREDVEFLRSVELELCRRDPVYWFNEWAWTYNPKLATSGNPRLPLDLFDRQTEMVRWFERLLAQKQDGLLEKSRDIGFTWCAGGYAWHQWRFVDGFKATFGSRKGEYVDRIGDPDSIFEKIRMLYRELPAWMWPVGFVPYLHDRHMLIQNPGGDAFIRGESGDEMGRGGRSTIYFIDEAAFIERAERVEAATSANTDVRVWGSSVNGNGNFFARKRFGGTLDESQIFRFHWSDDPRKANGKVVRDGIEMPWAAYEQKRLDPHVWASEFELDYSASVEGICIPAKWVESAKRLKTLIRVEPDRRGVVGGDVGGGGKGKSVAVARFGPVVCVPKSRSEGDTINTAKWMMEYCAEIRPPMARADKWPTSITSLHYDVVGVGLGVQSSLKRDKTPGVVKHGVNVGEPPTDMRWPDGKTSKEKFGNLKAEAWWTGRERFKKTHELVLWLEGDRENGIEHPVGECISLPSDKEGPDATVLAAQLSLVRVESNEAGKIVIQTKASLKKDGIASPDHADALMLTFAGNNIVDQWLRMLPGRNEPAT